MSTNPTCPRCQGHGSHYNEADEMYVQCGACTPSPTPPSRDDIVEALKPFAKVADYFPDQFEDSYPWVSGITLGDLRNARRAALSALPPQDERGRIVSWLRDQPSLVAASPKHVRSNSPAMLADAIERGDHLTDQVPPLSGEEVTAKEWLRRRNEHLDSRPGTGLSKEAGSDL